MKRSAWALIGILPMLLSGCMSLAVHDRQSGRPVALTLCQQGETVQQRSTLYFGASRPDGGVVSAAQWSVFLADVVTPAFPDGLTWYPAHGQWRGERDGIVAEDSRLLVLLHAGDAATRRRVDAVAEHYKKLFAQEAVLRERVAVCMRL